MSIDIAILVYRCNDFDSSCGVCKYHKTQGYKCDWCGSCKTTISGAPDRCKENELVQCQISLSGVLFKSSCWLTIYALFFV